MPAPDSSSDYDVSERLLAAARLVGMNEVRARWKIIRLQRWWRRLRQDLAPPSRRFDRQLCQSCGTLQAASVATCGACGERVGSPVGAALRKAGLSIPTALSVSSALGLVMVAIYARMILARPGQGILTWDVPTLVEFGGDYPAAVHAGQWWRLGTAIFLHIGLWHIAFNLLALAQIGPAIEEVFGRGRMLALFLVTGVLANVGSEALGTYSVSAGASGAIMGLIGVAAGWGQRAGTTQGRLLRDQMLKWAAYTLVFGYFIHANNWAHLFGFLAGAVLGFAGNPHRVQAKRHGVGNATMGAIGAVATAGLAFLCLRPLAASRAMATAFAAEADDDVGYDEGDDGATRVDEAYRVFATACRRFREGKEDDAVRQLRGSALLSFQHLDDASAREYLRGTCDAYEQAMAPACEKLRSAGIAAVVPAAATMPPADRERLQKMYESMCAAEGTR